MKERANIINEMFGVSIGDLPWVSIGRSGPVYDIAQHATMREALERTGAYDFASRCMVNLNFHASRCFFPFGVSGTSQVGWSQEWMFMWLHADDHTANDLVFKEWCRKTERSGISLYTRWIPLQSTC